MLRLSDIEIKNQGGDWYRITGPGRSCLETSREGVAVVLACDCTSSLEDAVSRGEQAVGANWDVRSLLELLYEQNILFDAERLWVPLFQGSQVLNNLESTGFRSLSEVNLCPSTACNLKCDYCISRRNKGSISKDALSRLIQDAARFGANTLNILGGEPSCFPTLTKHCIEEAGRYGMSRVLVSTNAQRLSLSTAVDWAARGLQTLQISIDTTSGDHKALDRLALGLDDICDIFEEVIVGYVFYGQHDQDELLSLIHLLLRWPVSIDLKTVIPFEGERLPCSPEEIASFEQFARRLSEVEARVYATPLGSDVVWCGAGGISVYVHGNGDTKPCPFVREVMGNLSGESFAAIWQDWGRWSHFREHRKLPKQCGSCSLVRHCINGCTARYRSRQANCILRQRAGEQLWAEEPEKESRYEK